MEKRDGAVIIADKIKRRSMTETIEGDLPYDRQLYVNEVRFLLQRTAEEIIEIGKRLLVLKEHEDHGRFIETVEGEIGIPIRTAQRFMHAAFKQKKFPKIQIRQFGASHLYTLLEAPEEDLRELEEKGVLAGQSMDELEAMSVKEMRALIRKLKQGAEKVIGKQVSKLEAKLADTKDRLKTLQLQQTDMPEYIRKDWRRGLKHIDKGIQLLTDLHTGDSVEGDAKVMRGFEREIKKLHGQFNACINILKTRLNTRSIPDE